MDTFNFAQSSYSTAFLGALSPEVPPPASAGGLCPGSP